MLLDALALGAATSPSFQSVTQIAEEQQPSRATGLERIVEELKKAKRVDTETLVTALLVSGPRGPEELFTALAQPIAPVPFGDTDAESLPFDDSVRDEIERALVSLPRWVLERFRRGDATPKRMAMEADLALAVIGERGDRQSLAVAIELVTPEDPAGRLDRRLGTRFEWAVAELLRRDPESIARIDDDFQKLPVCLRPALLRAAGTAPSSATLSFLGKRLDGAPELELIVLAEIGRVAAALREPCAGQVQTAVLMHLTSMDAALRREACLTVGKMDCISAAPDLIDLLRDENSGVRSNAHWALKRLTGKGLAAEPERWRTWFWKETLWWSEEAPSLIEQVRSGTPIQIGAAVREFSTHRLHRQELARELANLLSDENETIVRQACSGLGALRSIAAVSELANCLDHPSAEVRQSAHEALRSITDRHDLPAEREAWAQFWTRPDQPIH